MKKTLLKLLNKLGLYTSAQLKKLRDQNYSALKLIIDQAFTMRAQASTIRTQKEQIETLKEDLDREERMQREQEEMDGM